MQYCFVDYAERNSVKYSDCQFGHGQEPLNRKRTIKFENVFTGCYAECIAQIKHKKYEQSLEPVLVNDDCKILWDFNVQTNIVIEQRRPHIVFVDSLHRDTW